MKKKKKVVVIVGTTASGKTALAVDLAYKFGGEIISADSRQVYKYMNIGTGKDLNEYNIKSKIINHKSPLRQSCAGQAKITKIPYHLIDVAHPNTHYDLAKWLKKAKICINDILDRGRLPIIAGGTGLYSQALVDNFNLSKYGEDKKLRAKLEKKDALKLFEILLKLDEKFAKKLNNSEKNNKRRLIRYIEICKQGEKIKNKNLNKNNEYEFLLIGVAYSIEILRKRIYKRLVHRLEKEDMIGEVANLHKNKRVSWKRLESFGLEYKFITQYLRKKLIYKDMVEKLNIAIGQFAKKQINWLRRWEAQGAKINWVKNRREAGKICQNFLYLDK
ncbi:MAG: tRNA (adenosine(37)-N6)-dimethylallyltransferase MiaA [Patescibacteria group bacterium]|nr:tRNA (adenosine(37)-N6)-dimethylallyltransferase MiaA [Patescibacteria group bacterium]